MYFFISLSHHWIMSVHSFCHSHSDSIQDGSCIQLQCDSAQGICSCIVLSFLVFDVKMNLVSDSTQQCWVASKLGVVMM